MILASSNYLSMPILSVMRDESRQKRTSWAMSHTAGEARSSLNPHMPLGKYHRLKSPLALCSAAFRKGWCRQKEIVLLTFFNEPLLRFCASVLLLLLLLLLLLSHFSHCPTLCDPIDGSPPGSPVPRILQAKTLEWVAISFFNAWKWKVKVKSLSRVYS